jgi:hypothetical protein
MGVRSDKLRDSLGEWLAWWQLDTDDVDNYILRAHLMHWVNEALAGLAKIEDRTIGEVAYNTTWCLDMRSLWYVARMDRLQELESINKNTAVAAYRNTISKHVVNMLARRRGLADRMPADLLQSYLDNERAYRYRPSQHSRSEPVENTWQAEEIVDSERFRQAVRGLRGTSIDDVIELFLPLRCQVPVGDSAQPVMARTPSLGWVVYAFTSLTLLRDYQQTTGNRTIAGLTELTGRELLARVRNLRDPASIVVDPAAGDKSDVHAMFVLPAPVIAMIDLAEVPEK